MIYSYGISVFVSCFFLLTAVVYVFGVTYVGMCSVDSWLSVGNMSIFGLYMIYILLYIYNFWLQVYSSQTLMQSLRPKRPLLKYPPIATTTHLPKPNTLNSPSRGASMFPKPPTSNRRLTTTTRLPHTTTTISLNQHDTDDTLLLNNLPQPFNKRTTSLPELTLTEPKQNATKHLPRNTTLGSKRRTA